MPVTITKSKKPKAKAEQANHVDSIDFRVVPIADVSPNDYNPNDMETEFFESLVGAIKDEGGMHQPVLVRPDPDNEGKFLIVDGENRFRACTYLGHTDIPVVVVPYDETRARVRTLSFNNLRGQNIPIKLARLLVDLHKEYSAAEVRAMTGIAEDDQLSALDLLNVPTFNPSDGVTLTPANVERPISVSLLLMPDEHGAYTTAMKKAMKLIGDDVVALVGHEVEDYDKAMKGALGIAGVKLRNVAMALIYQTFNNLPPETQKGLVEAAHTMIYDKKASDGEAKQSKKAKTDKMVKKVSPKAPVKA